ncbi:MAG: YHS domain-containing (seleno)protein [Cyanobacteria bacterium P01_C01_bin.72]
MFKNKSLNLTLFIFSGLLIFAGYANSHNQLNGAANASVEVEIAQANSPRIRFFADNNGLAIRGTDPVAYFTQSKPVAGKAEFSHNWNGITWQFSTQENRDLFAANPEQYAPQYGGFCAWAVSQGYTAAIDPQAWKIVDGKLYLNYNQGIQRRWEKDISGNIKKANANWPGVL